MDYSQYFEQHNRLNSPKPIALVAGDRLVDFIKAVLADVSMPDKFKAAVIISLSGGLRITECLELTRHSFMEEKGNLYLRVNVLKRKKKEQRWARIHPEAAAFVRNYIKDAVGAVVKWTQQGAYKAMQKHFAVEGICNHTLRHSNISYMLFEEGMPHLEVARLLHIGASTVEYYAHLNERRTLAGLFAT